MSDENISGASGQIDRPQKSFDEQEEFLLWREQYWPNESIGSAYAAWRSARSSVKEKLEDFRDNVIRLAVSAEAFFAKMEGHDKDFDERVEELRELLSEKD